MVRAISKKYAAPLKALKVSEHWKMKKTKKALLW